MTRRWLVAGALALALAMPGSSGAQALSVSVVSDAVHVRATNPGILGTAVQRRLREGRAVPIDLELTIQAKRSGPVTARALSRCSVSFDVWEERFAVAVGGAAARAASHLSVRDAEAWCIERIAIPLSQVALAIREAPVWVRLTYRFVDDEDTRTGDTPLTLASLIDRLSRRQAASVERVLEVGPVRLAGNGS